jgi:hypothetical protein
MKGSNLLGCNAVSLKTKTNTDDNIRTDVKKNRIGEIGKN